MIALDEDAVAGFVAAPDGNDLVRRMSPVGRGGRCFLMAGEREAVLLFARDALRLGQELGGDAHHQRALAGAREELGVEVDAGIHRDVVHVLQAADDLHVLGIGQDRVRRLGERLQAAAAQAIDGRAARLDRQPGHQADRAGDVEPLLALLLRVAEDDVFDRGRIDAAALDERAHHGDGQVVGADVAKDALLRMSPANRRATGINNNGGFH